MHRFWKANGTAYMAMQYCPGVTLMQARRTMRAPPDEAWLRAVVEPILDALERLHRAGVFHRDISPDNILLLPNGRPILLDFGSARRVVGPGTKSLTAVLKPNFAPVEQYGDSAGMAQGPWTDLYALGATVHFMLTGEVPTPAVMRVVNDVRTPLAAAGGAAFPGVGARFLAAIDWTAAVAPKDRPQSVEALREALGYDEPPVPPPTAAPRAKRRGRRALVALALAAFGVLGVGCLVAASRRRRCSLRRRRRRRACRRRCRASRRRRSPQPQPRAGGGSCDAGVGARRRGAGAGDGGRDEDRRGCAAARSGRRRRSDRPAASDVDGAGRTDGARTRSDRRRGSRSPAEVCAGRNFIARAICISRQCQAAGSRMHPECVEARRIEEQRQRRMDR